MSQLLSVVLPTLNGGNLYKRLVSSLERQTIFSEMEIIIIDSGSTDSTLHLSKNITTHINIIKHQEFNHGGTRNLGAKLSSGSYISFLTQDAIPTQNDFFEKLISSMQQYNADGIYARQIPRKDASPLVCRDLNNWQSGLNERRTITIDSIKSFLQLNPIDRYLRCVFDNVASMVRREVWENIPFPTTPFGEDVEWAFRALCNGHTIVFEPDAVVEHSHERSPTYQYKRTYIDHYRLHELFGVRTIPSRKNAWHSFFKTTIQDWNYVLQRPTSTSQWIKSLRDTPRNAWASAWGQYDGAKASAMGKTVYQSKDV